MQQGGHTLVMGVFHESIVHIRLIKTTQALTLSHKHGLKAMPESCLQSQVLKAPKNAGQ